MVYSLTDIGDCSKPAQPSINRTSQSAFKMKLVSIANPYESKPMLGEGSFIHKNHQRCLLNKKPSPRI